jgi:hypothetical protein
VAVSLAVRKSGSGGGSLTCALRSKVSLRHLWPRNVDLHDTKVSLSSVGFALELAWDWVPDAPIMIWTKSGIWGESRHRKLRWYDLGVRFWWQGGIFEVIWIHSNIEHSRAVFQAAHRRRRRCRGG